MKNIKKSIVGLVCVLLMSSTNIVMASENEINNDFLTNSILDNENIEKPVFNDTNGHWAKKSIDSLLEVKTYWWEEYNGRKGFLINGYPDSTFKPDNKIKRSEVSKIISSYDFMYSEDHLNDLEDEKNIKSRDDLIKPLYVDVDNESYRWADIDIVTSKEFNYMSGYPDGEFKPEQYVTREEFSKMVSNFIERKGIVLEEKSRTEFNDIESSWAKKEIEMLGNAGILNGYSDGRFAPNEELTRAEVITIFLALSGKEYDSKPDDYGDNSFMNPTEGILTSPFGMRWGKLHKGIDIGASTGTAIVSSMSGVVEASEFNNGGYGYMVIVDHENGYKTLYAHCNELNVKVGDRVGRGQKIATVGNTGNSFGSHLHFEIHDFTSSNTTGIPTVDPAKFVKY